MSTARLNVWITSVGNPCEIDMEHQWFVHVLHCDGRILRWCGRTYTNIRTKCGHVEFPIPPGCYTVVATWSPAPPGDNPTSLGNHISHLSVVRANCGDHVCVTLFPPTFHWCGIWWLRALTQHMELGTIDREAGGRAVEAVQAVLEKVPMDEFTKAMEEIESQRGQPSDFDDIGED